MEKVLIVDDEELNHQAIKRFLFVQNICSDNNFLDAYNGREGLELFIKNHREIKAIILDINMPILDGWKFLELLLKKYTREELLAIKILVFTSSFARERVSFLAEKYGINLHFLEKDFQALREKAAIC